MREVYGNAWEYQADCVIITTNGSLRRDGACVMGQGIAREARDRYPGLDRRIGQAIRAQGNHVYMMGDFCTFPVKHRYWERADLDLIKRSAEELAAIAREFPDRTFVLPRPGCGNGGLRWSQVKPVIEEVLPGNVHVITFTHEEGENESLSPRTSVPIYSS